MSHNRIDINSNADTSDHFHKPAPYGSSWSKQCIISAPKTFKRPDKSLATRVHRAIDEKFRGDYSINGRIHQNDHFSELFSWH